MGFLDNYKQKNKKKKIYKEYTKLVKLLSKVDEYSSNEKYKDNAEYIEIQRGILHENIKQLAVVADSIEDNVYNIDKKDQFFDITYSKPKIDDIEVFDFICIKYYQNDIKYYIIKDKLAKIDGISCENKLVKYAWINDLKKELIKEARRFEEFFEGDSYNLIMNYCFEKDIKDIKLDELFGILFNKAVRILNLYELLNYLVEDNIPFSIKKETVKTFYTEEDKEDLKEFLENIYYRKVNFGLSEIDGFMCYSFSNYADNKEFSEIFENKKKEYRFIPDTLSFDN